ncbi:MAG: magnesium transporter [Chloroflexota bacterium]|jgi:magnesium transporter|nr:magnesium transporter [Chloroflexota bacterium]
MASTPQNPALPSEAVAPRPALKPATIRVVAVDGDTVKELEGSEAIAALPDLCKPPSASVWIDLTSPSVEQAKVVGRALQLHPLIVEDVLEGDQRAKIETTDGVIHIVLFHLTYDEKVAPSELDIVLGPGFLLTVHEESWDPRESNHLRSGLEPILRHGPDHLLWALADDIVDDYFPFADRLGYAIDEVQNEVVRKASPDTLEHLFVLKRELIEVRRAVGPVREVFNQLTNRDIALIDDDELVYFRDIYDHIIRLTDELDNYRELASATLDVYLSTINNNLSIIMKRLTGVTVILAGVGAIAGIFGMSEAGTALGGKEAGGFWLVTAITIGLASAAAIVLRKIDWI